MTRNNFWYIKNVVIDMQDSIDKDFYNQIDFDYGKLLAISVVGLKIDSFMAQILIDIFLKGSDNFLKIYPEDINLDDYCRIVRFRNSLYS